MGGPQPPGPNATEEEKKSYEGKQKAFTDTNVVTDHTGDQFPHIRLMTVVENSPLMTGHTFAKKDTMMIRGLEYN